MSDDAKAVIRARNTANEALLNSPDKDRARMLAVCIADLTKRLEDKSEQIVTLTHILDVLKSDMEART